MNSRNAKYGFCLSIVIALNAAPAFSIGKRDITVTTAENGVNLSLSRGYGVVVNLSTIGQTVSTAWLSDPSQITLASNKGPCTGDACSGASVLYLKPIDRLNFPGLPSAADGGSLLSVITNSGAVLQFRLSVTSSPPSYTSVALVPAQQRLNPPTPEPRFPLQQTIVPSPPPPPRTEPKITVDLPNTQLDDLKILAKLHRDKSSSNDDSEANSNLNPETSGDDSQIKAETEPDKETKPIPENKSDSETQPESSSETETETNPNSDDDDSTPEIEPSGSTPSVIAVLESEQGPKSTVNQTNQEIAGALLRGIHSERGRKEIGKSIHYQKAQDVIWILKKDENISLTEAIRRARMDEKVAMALINYGKK